MATTFKFDKGPSASWAKRFFEAPRAYYLTHASARFRTEFGPVYYRGRLNGSAKLLIVGQDPSTDEILAQRENAIQAIISFGNGADLAINNWPTRPAAVPWFQLHHPSADDNIVLPNWNANLNNLRAAVTPDKLSLVNLTPYGVAFGAQDVADIPREDLAFGIADWHGTGGATRSQRNGDNVINWTSPL